MLVLQPGFDLTRTQALSFLMASVIRYKEMPLASIDKLESYYFHFKKLLPYLAHEIL